MDVRSQSFNGLPPRQVHRLPHLLVSPARTCGPTERAPSTCGGTTSRPSREPATRRQVGRPGASTAGGWQIKNGKKLRAEVDQQAGPHRHQHLPSTRTMPSMDDYYEPWTYDYQYLFNAPEGDGPADGARPISMVTGELIKRSKSGPNWDDDLGGSPEYAEERLQPGGAQRAEQRAAALGDRAAGVLLLPADLQPLHESVVRGLVPFGRALQAGGRRHRAGGTRKALPGLAFLHRGLPLQEGVLQLVQTGKSGKVHPLLSRGSRPARRLPASTPAWAGSATSECCCTTPPRSKAPAACVPTRS